LWSSLANSDFLLVLAPLAAEAGASNNFRTMDGNAYYPRSKLAEYLTPSPNNSFAGLRQSCDDHHLWCRSKTELIDVILRVSG